MKYLRHCLAALAACLFMSSAAAQDLPKPLGIPLGASVEEAAAALGGVPMQESGASKFTGGPVFTAPGNDLGVVGLSEVLLIFDKERRLAALQMTMAAGDMNKNGYDRVLAYLKQQYPLKSNQNPFVGDKLAVFETKGARIELSAPHLSFDMLVTYMTKQFHRKILEVNQAEGRTRQQREREKF